MRLSLFLFLVPSLAAGQSGRPASAAAALKVALPVGAANLIGGDHEFTSVSYAKFGPNGLLAVAQPQDAQVLLFDLAHPARPVAVAGRRGEGPGEFSSLGGIGWVAGTLWATDNSRPRAEFFNAAGRVLTSTVFDVPASAVRQFRYFAPSAILQDTTVVYFPSTVGSPGGPTATNPDATAPILLKRRGASHLDTLALLQPLRSMLVLNGDLSGTVGTQPFAGRNFLRTGQNGQRLLLVLQAGPIVPDGRALVRVVTSTGALVYGTDLGMIGTVVTDAVWDSVVAAKVKGDVNVVFSTDGKAREGYARGLIRPRFYPIISDAVLGQDGTVWLKLATEVRGKATWLVLSSKGEALGSVALPSATRILDVTASKAVGVVKDADGVEQPFWMTVGRR